MSENKTLLQKADLVLADLAGGGALLPEQANTFIRTLMDSPTLINVCRVVPMRSPSTKINKIGFGTRILRPAVASTALSQGDRSKPSFGQVELITKEVIAEIRIPYAVMEDNIERAAVATNGAANSTVGGLHATILQMIAERSALDLEELMLLGDTTSGDAYLALMDGWLKRCSTHIVDAAAAPISRTLLKNGVKAMPDKYLRDRNALMQMVSIDNETDLRELFAARQTALGDAQAQGTTPLYIHGSRVVGVPMMPTESGLYVNPNNLIMGIQREISLEFDKDIQTREYIIVLTARIANAVEEIDAAVQYQDFGA